MRLHGLTLIFALFLTIISAVAQPPDTLWTRTFGGAYDDSAVAVVLTDDGGFVAAGNGAFSVLKADSFGSVQWTRSCPAQIADITQTDDGGFAIAGTVMNPDSFLWGAYLARLDANGDVLWSRQYTDTSFYTGRAAEALAVTPDGGFVLTGTYFNEYMWSNLFVMVTDSVGDTLWTFQTQGWFNSEGGHDVQVDHNGIIYIAGHINPYPSGHYMWGLRFSVNGDTLGLVTHTWSDSWSRANAVAIRPDGSYLLAGWQYTSWEPQYGAYVAHISSSDEFVQSSGAGSTADDVAYDIALTSDGGFIIAGFSNSFVPYGTAYVVKFDPTGQLEWQKTVGSVFGDEVAYGIGVYPNGEILLAGKSRRGWETDFDAYFVKLAAPMTSNEQATPLPSSLSLSAYPNPFNSTTAFTFTVPQSGNLTLRVFDLLGREVETLLNGEMTAGEHTISYSPAHLGSGIYFARLNTSTTAVTQKLVILK